MNRNSDHWGCPDGVFVVGALMSFVWTPFDTPRSISPTSCKPRRRQSAWHGSLWPRHSDDDHGGCAHLDRGGTRGGGHRHAARRPAGPDGGGAAWSLAGRSDHARQRPVFAFPSLVIAILITAVFGARSQRDHRHRHLQYPRFRPPDPRRCTSLWEREFILAARVAGKGAARISAEHILPNIANLLIVQGTIQFSWAFLPRRDSVYVGLGAQPPTPSWGRMLADAQTLVSPSRRISH